MLMRLKSRSPLSDAWLSVTVDGHTASMPSPSLSFAVLWLTRLFWPTAMPSLPFSFAVLWVTVLFMPTRMPLLPLPITVFRVTSIR